jgi:hypothetical protein
MFLGFLPFGRGKEMAMKMNLAKDLRVRDRFVEEVKRFQPREEFVD